MGFLAPLFLFGLGGIAVPIIIHMIQRERREILEFPSLMFMRKISFHSFRRQRIRHWFLLFLRCLALLLLIIAFARPFFWSSILATGITGAREVVILLDRSYSMGYSDRWNIAKNAATVILNDLAAEDRATVILFDNEAESGLSSTTNRANLTSLIAGSELSDAGTRYGPALKLAERILESSNLPRLEAVLISDFQRIGIDSTTEVNFPEGTILTPITVGSGDEDIINVSVAGVFFDRRYFSGRERVQVSARLTNRSIVPVTDLDVTLEMDGRSVETLTIDSISNGSITVEFSSVTLGSVPMNGTVRIESDALLTDDVFYFVVSPGQIVNVLIVSSGRGSDDSNLFFTRALGIGSEPAFDVRMVTIDEFSASDLDDRQVVVLNDTRPPSGQFGRVLAEFVETGGGLLVVTGERSVWPTDSPDLLPGQFGSPINRLNRGGSLGFVDYSHPVFELFSAPRSGDVTTTRFFRYRPVTPFPSATVLARFDDGSAALTERRVGDGIVLLWASTVDSFWNDLPKKPVYLPFVHKLIEYLADYTPPSPWFSVGQVIDFSSPEVRLGTGGVSTSEYVVMSPSGTRNPIDIGERTEFIDLREQGFYEIHDVDAVNDQPLMVAVNVDFAESNLTMVDPEELASMITGRAGGERNVDTGQTRLISAENLESQQSIWWYFLIGAFLLFIAETVVSNRLSRTVLNAD